MTRAKGRGVSWWGWLVGDYQRQRRWAASLGIGLLSANALWAAERIRVKEGTPLRVRLKSNLRSDQAKAGTRVDFEVAAAVVIRGWTVIPAGAEAWGAIRSVKKKKYIKFDIAHLQVPGQRQIKLRALQEKSGNPGADQITIESRLDGVVGAARGAEFTAYVDRDAQVIVSVRAPPAPAAPEPAPPSAVTPPPASSASREIEALGASADLVTLQCFSDPLGADILLDGDFVGSTPSILKVKPTRHRLEYHLAGYKAFAQDLDLISARRLITVQISLEKTR